MYFETLKGGLVGSFFFFFPLPVCPVSDVEFTFYRQNLSEVVDVAV